MMMMGRIMKKIFSSQGATEKGEDEGVDVDVPGELCSRVFFHFGGWVRG